MAALELRSVIGRTLYRRHNRPLPCMEPMMRRSAPALTCLSLTLLTACAATTPDRSPAARIRRHRSSRHRASRRRNPRLVVPQRRRARGGQRRDERTGEERDPVPGRWHEPDHRGRRPHPGRPAQRRPGRREPVVVGNLPQHRVEQDLQHRFADAGLGRHHDRDHHRRENAHGCYRRQPPASATTAPTACTNPRLPGWSLPTAPAWPPA